MNLVKAYKKWCHFLGHPVVSTGKAMKFKFGQNNNRVHPNKSPLKFWSKGSVGVSRPSMDCPIFGYRTVRYPKIGQSMKGLDGIPYYIRNG